MDGWISLHRKILDNPVICQDSDYFTVWCYLLLNATHIDYDVMFKGERITLKPGQLITGRKVIADKFNITESKVQRILKKFEIEQQIEQLTSARNRLISIVKWCEYQESEQLNEQLVNNCRTTSEQLVNTNNNIITYNKINNKKKKQTEIDIFLSEKIESEDLKKSLYEFIKMRKAIKKPLTLKGLELIVKKLDKIASNTNEKIQILDNSIMNNWQGVFPLKQNTQSYDKQKESYDFLIEN